MAKKSMAQRLYGHHEKRKRKRSPGRARRVVGISDDARNVWSDDVPVERNMPEDDVVGRPGNGIQLPLPL